VVFDIGGSNPSSPTMAIVFSVWFAAGVWLALWASDEKRDGWLILGVTIACAALFIAQCYY